MTVFYSSINFIFETFYLDSCSRKFF